MALYSVPSLNPDATLDDMVAIVKQTNEYRGKPQVHVSGRLDDGQREDQFGTIYDQDEISFTFHFAADVPDADRQEIIDSVLESVVWS